MKRAVSFISLVFALLFLNGNSFAGDRFNSPFLLSGSVEEVKLALIGDTGAGENFGKVLKMIADEKANAVMINGDLGYGSSADTWKNRVLASVNPDELPVIGVLGNHDMGGQQEKFIAAFDSFRNAKNGLKVLCSGTTGLKEGHDITAVDEVCTFGNVTVIGSAIKQVLSSAYLEKQLEAKLKNAPVTNWKLAGYHYTLSSMNPGIKGNENTFRFFDLIRQYGAIGAQAHTHSVMASCPIVSPFKSGQPIQCHPDFTELEARFIMPGTSVYVDSSLGGKEVRNRGRCKTASDEGCKHMVDLITSEGYTRIDNIKTANFNRFGALFFVFNAGGDPTKAHVYFKSIDGTIVFDFWVHR